MPTEGDREGVNPRTAVSRNVNWLKPLWRTIQGFLKKLRIELPYNTAVPLLGIYLKNMKVLIKIYVQNICTSICTNQNICTKYVSTLLLLQHFFQ